MNSLAPSPVAARVARLSVRAEWPSRPRSRRRSDPQRSRSSTWPELLAGRGLYVCNQGISGNRLLHDGLGASSLARFDRDELATPGLGYVIVSLGHSDISIANVPRDDDARGGFLTMFPGDPVTSDDVIAGCRQLIARARDRGVKIYITTITPDEGSEIHTAGSESARQAINSWIRAGGPFDGVLNFDAAWRDPARPSRIRDDLHAGDHLHGNDAGYRVLADSIDPSLFS
jgi:lysophospholipase L1-like esterase